MTLAADLVAEVQYVTSTTWNLSWQVSQNLYFKGSDDITDCIANQSMNKSIIELFLCKSKWTHHFLGQYCSYDICYFQCASIISGFTRLISLQGGLIVGLLAWAGVRNWRTLMLVCSAPTGLIALLWFAIPESPRWLIAKGQWTLIPT